MQETWEFPQSNAKQQYATHSFIRYYGKLPPVVTKRIIIEGSEFLKAGPILDIACGSGTTLVEASLLGIPSEGVDINPLSVLASNVKTTPISLRVLDKAWMDFQKDVSYLIKNKNGKKALSIVENELPQFNGRDRWFDYNTQIELTLMVSCLKDVINTSIRDFLKVGFASVIRRSSKASERSGRIFKEIGKVSQSPWQLLQKKYERMRNGLEDYCNRVNGFKPLVRVADAKNTELPNNHYGLVFFHPPYFALYKYSSDVLRFELQWLGIDRKEIAREEIRDGFKTTQIEDLNLYLDDLLSVFRESRRIVHKNGAFVVICNNSTLRKKALPVISGILNKANSAGFRLQRHAVRAVRYSQASYHRSADKDIYTPRDHILYFVPI